MSLSQGELVALAYGAVLVVLLVYVAIIAAKLARLDRESADLADLVHSHGPGAAEVELDERPSDMSARS